MTETTAIVVSIIGTGLGIVGVTALMLRILTTNTNRQFDNVSKQFDNVGKQFETNTAQMREMKADLGARIDDTNRRIQDTNQQINGLTTEMHQRFDAVHRELAEHRERMAKLEGALEGFLAGRRDRDAA